MLRETLIRLSQQEQLRSLASNNGMAQSVARRFVAGEDVGEAIKAVRELNAAGMTATLDHLGENVRTEAEAREAAQCYCRIVSEIAAAGIRCNVSLKLSQFGLDLSSHLARENVERVLDEAAKSDMFVRIDMESSDYIDRTLEIFAELWARYQNVGVVLQSYLYRTDADVERINSMGARVRLVKGAYLEPASVAYQAKADVDAAFVRAMRALLLHGNYPAIATHDATMIDATKSFARQEGIGPDRYEFQMLYGIRRDLQTQLVREGYNVRIYVPFGQHWYPYMMRRMAERPANLLFVIGNIARELAPTRH